MDVIENSWHMMVNGVKVLILDLFLYLFIWSLQTSSIIQMLMTASDHISTRVQSRSHGHRSLDNANTLIRILCHKKDIEASKFLKKHYRLPPSSGDSPVIGYKSVI